MLFLMYEVFSSLLGLLLFSVHFSFTFMEQLFKNHPVFCTHFTPSSSSISFLTVDNSEVGEFRRKTRKAERTIIVPRQRKRQFIKHMWSNSLIFRIQFQLDCYFKDRFGQLVVVSSERTENFIAKIVKSLFQLQ